MSEGFLEALLYSDDNLVPTSLPPSFPQGPEGLVGTTFPPLVHTKAETEVPRNI